MTSIGRTAYPVFKRMITAREPGHFPKLEEIPDVVVGHVREALERPAGVVAEVDADRTAKRHREFVRTRLGVKYNPAQARKFAEEAIRDAAQTKDNPADLTPRASRCRCPVWRHCSGSSFCRGSGTGTT